VAAFDAARTDDDGSSSSQESIIILPGALEPRAAAAWSEAAGVMGVGLISGFRCSWTRLMI